MRVAPGLNYGRSGSITIVIDNAPPNAQPVAQAGSDQQARVGELVTLHGSGSDQDGHLPLSYAWVQTAGPAVKLSDSASASPSFTAPDAPANLEFRLTVTDSQGLASVSDAVVITVAGQRTFVPLLALATAPAL